MNLYAMLIGLGASFGMWRVSQLSPKNQLLASANSALWVLAGSLIGSRIGFIFWQPGYIEENGWQALRIWEGGLIWPGAIAGAWITITILAFYRKLDIRILADNIAPLLPPIAIMTWLACISTGSGYGALISSDFHFPLFVNERGEFLSRFPNQWLAAISLFFLFLILERKLKTKIIGLYAAMIWLVFSLHTLLFSFFRADLRPLWRGLAVDIWGAIVLVSFSFLFLSMILLFKKKLPKETSGLKI